jgi:glyoxylase-like metal-dependent hydrolase (beta-lactamase superfamily II)/8-oxo-dGTP pyrophosphatase MutT (NUDIX family)
VPASAVLVFRDGPEGREVLLVRRGEDRRFAGGFHAFPGGRLDPADAAVPVPGLPADEAPYLACAARELFEETGILAVPGAERIAGHARDESRRALLEERASFAEVLARHGLALDPDAFAPAGRWVTPPHLPIRFDARFFLVRLPPGEVARVWPGELAGGGFVPARRALAAWERGEMLLHPPNLWGVTVLARDGPPDPGALRTPPHCDGGVPRQVEFQRGVLLAAQRTPTLPPAAHTNAWLVEADGGLAVVDPGSPDPSEQAALEALIDELAAEGRPANQIWLTHAHPDHAGGVSALAARRGLPVLAHPRAADRLEAPLARTLREGDLVGGRWLVLETPGHAPDHLAFLDERSGALLCGDMVSTLSTILVDPSEGDMEEYERQLERLRALGPRTLYPGHGPPAPSATARLAAYRSHRREREALVRAALRAGGTLGEITARAYADTPAALHPVAARSCLAILEKLRTQGVARLDQGTLWGRIEPAP